MIFIVLNCQVVEGFDFLLTLFSKIQVYIYSTKPHYSFKKNILPHSRTRVPGASTTHSTNLPIPTPAGFKSVHIIQFLRRYQVLVHVSIESTESRGMGVPPYKSDRGARHTFKGIKFASIVDTLY